MFRITELSLTVSICTLTLPYGDENEISPYIITTCSSDMRIKEINYHQGLACLDILTKILPTSSIRNVWRTV